MNKIIAVVGMPGAGKTEVVKIFVESGFHRVYFGDPVFERLKREGLKINEENEKIIREKMRKEGGMDIMARLSLPKINDCLKEGNVVVESLYSWEEYKLLKEEYGDNFNVLAVYSSPKTRYERLEKRPVRSLSEDEARNRDYSEIENLHIGGPIAMSDFIIVNEGSLEELKKKVREFIRSQFS